MSSHTILVDSNRADVWRARRISAALLGALLLVPIAGAAQAQEGEESSSSPRIAIAPLANDTTSAAARAALAHLNEPMTYHGGPVQRTQKVFTIFWNPTGTPAFPAGYQAINNQYVQDLNGSPYYGIAQQYSDTTGNIGTAVTFGGTWLDTVNPLPPQDDISTNLAALQAEVTRAKAANGWTSDGNSYFQVYTPSGYGTTTGYCGFHAFGNPAYGIILFPADHGVRGTCLAAPGPFPNSQVIDHAINTSSHEIMETVTDPAGNAWFWVDGSGEIGDLCNFNFGARRSDGSNVTLAGHNYLTQQEWSNGAASCVLSSGAFTLTVNKVGNGTVTSSSGGIICGGLCSGSFAPGHVVALTPTPAAGWSFGGWTGDADCVDGVVTMSAARSCTATFRLFRTTPNGDFDGDGKADITVFRPSTGTWFTIRSSTGTAVGTQWGNANDVVVPGDYDGDGRIDIAIFRPSTGTWFIVNSSTGGAVGIQWGNGADRVVPADYDGDGKTDIAVFRPSNGTWFIVNSSTGTAVGIQWGNGSDIAILKRP